MDARRTAVQLTNIRLAYAHSWQSAGKCAPEKKLFWNRNTKEGVPPRRLSLGETQDNLAFRDSITNVREDFGDCPILRSVDIGIHFHRLEDDELVALFYSLAFDRLDGHHLARERADHFAWSAR